MRNASCAWQRTATMPSILLRPWPSFEMLMINQGLTCGHGVEEPASAACCSGSSLSHGETARCANLGRAIAAGAKSAR
eukprot:424937-Alexandrium_andersonii.AAC.1